MDNVVYPLFAFLDDQTMLAVENPDRILYHFEATDIENDEYLFWDSTERAVRIGITKNRVIDVSYCDSTLSLRDAFLSYVEAVGLPRALVDGKPVDILVRIKTELGIRPKKRHWLSRVLGS
jgi:hypothetical protein